MIAFAIVTETIFAWPGTGKLLIDSINQLDRPVIVAYLLVILTLFILIILWSMWCVQSSIHAYAWARNLEEDIEMNAIPVTNPPVESPFQRLWSEFAESKLALIGLALLVIIVLVAIFAPLISPQNPYDLGQLDITLSTRAGREIGRGQHPFTRHRRAGSRYVVGYFFTGCGSFLASVWPAPFSRWRWVIFWHDHSLFWWLGRYRHHARN